MKKTNYYKKDSDIESSIIILSLLRQSHTAHCLESIFQHTSGSFEIIVVDMGKSKQITSWLKKLSIEHKNLTVIFNKKNVGTAKGRNQAIRLARGQYIVFLDNDAYVSEGWLTPLIETAKRDKTIGACGAKIVFTNMMVQYSASRVRATTKNGAIVRIGVEFLDVLEKENAEVNQIKNVPWYPTTCLLVKRKVLDSIGGLDENFFIAEEDKDLSLSIRKKGFKILYIPSSCVYHDCMNPSTSYKKIRFDVRRFIDDINYFEKKWNCKSFLNFSKKYLKKTTKLTDRQIEQRKNPLLYKVIDK